MENSSIATENCSTATCNSTEYFFVPLPVNTVVFAPILLLKFVAAVVSNAILLALVMLACVHKFNNNINIYLFSLSIIGFMGAFSTFCTFIFVVARRWILGETVCVLNLAIVIIFNYIYLILYLIISRDKYRVIKGSSSSRPSKKRAYILSLILWSLGISAIALPVCWMFVRDELSSVGEENFICYGIKEQPFANRTQFIFSIVFLIVFWGILFVIIFMSLFYFVQIIFELRKPNRIRQHISRQSCNKLIIKINERNIPLHISGEEGTAKSFALVFFIHFFAMSLNIILYIVVIIQNTVLGFTTETNPNRQFLYLAILIARFFPSTGPVFLIFSNKRLRMRVKGLFRCELNPNVADSLMNTTDRSVDDKPTTQKKSSKNRILSKFLGKSRVQPQPF